MPSFFSEPTKGKVLVIEPASSVRQMISDVISNLGFSNVQTVATAKDAVEIMEVEEIHWIISPILISADVNAMHLLKLIVDKPRLRHTHVSLMVDSASEDYCLVQAFELGLLSFHPKSYVKEMLQSEFEQLISLLKIYQFNATLVAAEYLRGVLVSMRLFKSRLSLEQNLLAMYPGSAKVLMNLAEAEFLSDRKEEGRACLSQVELIDPRFSAHCKKLRQKYLSLEEQNVAENTPIKRNVFAIKCAVIVDPDTDVLHHCRELLEKVGIKQVEVFENGEEAYKWLQVSAEPDLIIQEWRIPGINGPLLVQRIRQLGFVQVPIIVASSLVSKKDTHLLREMNVDEVIEKPFDATSLYSTIVWTIQQNRSPMEQKTLELRIRRLLEAKKTGEAERLIALFLADGRIEAGAKCEIEAHYEFSLGHTERALELGIEALKLGGDSIGMLSLVGKSMLLLKQFEGALSCFEKAHSISPLNIDRLLNIAEINLKLEKPEAAVNAVEEAKKIDSTGPDIVETEAKVRLQQGDIDSAQKMMSQLESGNKILAFMNNRAVSLTKAGRFEESIATYKNAIAAIPDKWIDLRNIVHYNLGLAYARYGDLALAKQALDAVDKDDSPINKKSQSLKKRVEQCLADGTPLQLIHESDQLSVDTVPVSAIGEASDPPIPVSAKNNKERLNELISRIEARRGDIGCYLVFQSVEGVDPKALELLKNPPHFVERSSIERPETFKGKRAIA